MQRAHLSGWLKEEGELLLEGEPLLELETEKAVNVVDSPVSGRLAKIVAEPGTTYPVGEILAVILAEGEEWDEAMMAAGAAASELKSDHLADGAPATPAAEAATGLVAAPGPGHAEGSVALSGASVPSSPAARRLARAYGLALAGVAGSGPGGRVVVEDVLARLPETTALPGSRFILLGGRAVHLLDVGQGPPLLLLHGAGGSNWTWVPVLKRLSTEFRLLAPDFPGCGLSEAVEADYSLDFYAGFVEELLDALQLRPVHLMGNSLGGAVAAHVAACHPEAVDRLVLVDCAGLGTAVHPELHSRLLQSDRPEGARASLSLLFHNPRLVTHGLVEETLRQRRRPGAMEALAKTIDSMLAPEKQLIDVRSDLERISAEVLLVWGREDRVTPLAQAQELTAALPHLRLEVVDECGHVPPAEQPAAFARVVSPFLHG
jgi:pimeloyl-ACP methyl ester carboxylesterase